jgi:hypothetical protein
MKTLILNGSTKANGDVAAMLGAFTENLGGEVVTLSFSDNITPCADCRSCWINIASRFIQPYFAASHFQNIKTPIKPKNGVLILCGGEPGTEQGAVKLAGTLFKHMRATCVETVMSMDTNNLPTKDDISALSTARQAADKLNNKLI